MNFNIIYYCILCIFHNEKQLIILEQIWKESSFAAINKEKWGWSAALKAFRPFGLKNNYSTSYFSSRTINKLRIACENSRRFTPTSNHSLHLHQHQYQLYNLLSHQMVWFFIYFIYFYLFLFYFILIFFFFIYLFDLI